MTSLEFEEGFQENDLLRSAFIKRLLKVEPTVIRTENQRTQGGIPKTLVRFWHNVDELPSDVAECLDSWEVLRSEGFQIATFDDLTTAHFIERNLAERHVHAFRRCDHPAMRSDYFRLCFILMSGGFYVDADDVFKRADWRGLYEDDRLKLQPLCYDVASQSMVPPEEIWQRDLPATDRIFYVNNNPLVAPPGHPVVRRALERATAALLCAVNRTHEIQSTTGPGNLTAALAAHAREIERTEGEHDFTLMRDWHRMAETRWELSYRNDARNWRNIGDGTLPSTAKNEAFDG